MTRPASGASGKRWAGRSVRSWAALLLTCSLCLTPYAATAFERLARHFETVPFGKCRVGMALVNGSQFYRAEVTIRGRAPDEALHAGRFFFDNTGRLERDPIRLDAIADCLGVEPSAISDFTQKGADLTMDGTKFIGFSFRLAEDAASLKAGYHGYYIGDPPDHEAPTVRTTLGAKALTATNRTTNVQFEFSEPVKSFTVADVATRGVRVSNLTGGGTVYSATVSASLPDATGALSVIAGSYSDLAGNPGEGGAQVTILVNTNPVAPRFSYPDGLLSTANRMKDVTITFPLPVEDFDQSDLLALEGDVRSVSKISPNRYLVRVAESGRQDATALVLSVRPGGYTDALTGAVGLAGSVAIPMDLTPPTATITYDRDELDPAHFSTRFDLVFSEDVVFAESDVTGASGYIRDFAGSGRAYTGTFYHIMGSRGANQVLNGGIVVTKFRDLAGNAGPYTSKLLDYWPVARD